MSNDGKLTAAQVATQLSAIAQQFRDGLITRNDMNRLIAEVKARKPR